MDIRPLKKQKVQTDSYQHTINREVLNFDFEKVCSVTLSHNNVYCCLVCGKYFQGRSISSPAYNHTINIDHHIFLNLKSQKFYILPENQEIDGIQDIKDLLDPKYTKDDVNNLPETALDLHKKSYYVGYTGLDNISNNDYENVIIQALSHIRPIRDFYLRLSYRDKLHDQIQRKSILNDRFGILIRKLWSIHLYRNHVSPHELLQYVSEVSKSQFSLTVQKSPKKFLIWLLNGLHSQLVKYTKSTVISESLQGALEITSFDGDGVQVKSTTTSKFWVITVDLPPAPLFVGETIQEVQLSSLLAKYNGETKVHISKDELRSYKLVEPLPPYLIIHIDRGLEKEDVKKGNPTVVQFQDVIDFAPFVTQEKPTPINYRLLSTIKHDSITGDEIDESDIKSEWSINVRKKVDDTWFTIKDSEVKPCQGELLFLDENYIQIWEKVE
ncbi:ubiquitin specific protease [Scheffersomyces coipomensis]|uniref:ubiquitin specific protease n=1 Tax=Scheffersomyces coipomensis TaxID=1788519 RepID=UPI00315DB714